MNLPQIGELFEGRYKIERVLGEGGYARVYRARDETTQRDVALKVLMPRQGEYDPAIGARFLREARVIAGLQDPHTITMYDFGRCESGLLFIACEFVDGEDLLATIRRRGPLSVAVTSHILAQLVSSLREAHAHGVFHRDIKPANVMVFEYQGDPNRVKLLDFGLAKSIDVTATAITQQGRLVGTPRYMAPERIMSDREGPQGDIYSLGLVTYEMLTGHPAIEGSTPEELCVAQVNGPPIVVPDEAAPAGFRRIVERMVRRDPSERYRSIEEVQRDLTRGEERPLGVEKSSAPTPARRPRRSLEEASAPPAVSPRLFILAIATLTCVVGVLAVVALTTAADETVDTTVVRPTRPQIADPARAFDAHEKQPVEPASSCGEHGVRPGRSVVSELIGLEQVSHPVYIPKSYEGGTRHPLVVLLHDRSTSERNRDMTALPEVRQVADRHGVVMISPDGGFISPWDDPKTLPIVEDAIELAAAKLCLDAARIYVVGHGFGGEAAERLACKGKVAAIATSHYAIAGKPKANEVWPGGLCKPKQLVPRIHVWGNADPFNPVEGGRGCQDSFRRPLAERQEWRRKLQKCGEESRVLMSDGSTCVTWECQSPLVVCNVEGGHRWPGMPERIVDVASPIGNCANMPTSFPVMETIWQFFANSGREDRGLSGQR